MLERFGGGAFIFIFIRAIRVTDGVFCSQGAGGGDDYTETVGDVWARAGSGGSGRGGRFKKLNVLLASDAGFDLSEHSCGLICANA